MSVDIRSSERRRYMDELQAREKEIAAGLHKASQPASPKGQPETDKRIRREIANSNERRRMQCINAGFTNLKALIPQLEGEKLSKAAILQHTTEYISSLVKEKTRLQVQLERTNQLLVDCGQDRLLADPYIASSPVPSKRKKRDTESSDEGVGSLSDTSDEGSHAEIRQENTDLRLQLESERQRISGLEEQNRILEAQLLSFMNGGSQQPTLGELQPVKVESNYPPPVVSSDSWGMYNREVIEVSGADLPVSAEKGYVPPLRPLSPTPERGLAMEVSLPECQRYMEVPCDLNTKHLGVASIKQDEMDRPPMVCTPVTAVPQAAPTPPMPTATPPIKPAVEGAPNPHHHNYCHRDHPRRRLRKKAQLEQQQAEEEEARRRQEEQQLQLQRQQQALVASATTYRPKQSAQNLENLVEAIRQIEGDKMLCQIEGERSGCEERRLYEEECLYNQRKSTMSATDDSERETTSISDQEELRGDLPSSGGESPAHPTCQRQGHPPCHVIPSIPASSSSAPSSSSFSDKYPIASQLLHRPLPHPTMFRPGVIVHKQ